MSVSPDPPTRIQLAREPGFKLGRLTVLPATREVRRDDGTTEVIEPRVMQVLVALTRAEGHVVSRDVLTQRCWERRVVGEDAINRVMSRLRRLAEGLGQGSFKLETITKVGFRLIQTDHPSGLDEVGAAGAHLMQSARRELLIGGALIGGIAAVGIGVERLLREPGAKLSPQSARLMSQALLALRQSTREGANQAVGLLRRVVGDQPNFADGWGALATTYAYTARYRSAAEAGASRRRAVAAAECAEAIEPDNAYAAIGRAVAVPSRGSWLQTERVLRRAMTLHPDHDFLPYALAILHSEVGRNRESAAALRLLRLRGEPNPGLYYTEIMATWAANQLEEADRLIGEASQLYPSHVAIWFARFSIQLYSGRAGASSAMIEDVQGRPTGLAASEFLAIAPVARAVLSRSSNDIDAVLSAWSARAREGSGYAVDAAQFASALGRVDDAFALLHAYYFSRGFVTPEVSFAVEQGIYSPVSERPTAFLFWPSMEPVRRDPRFAALTRELGLAAYWRNSRSTPDHLSS